MFGLTMQERLFKAIKMTTANKIYVYENEIKKTNWQDITEDEQQKAYANIMQVYTNEISSEIAKGMSSTVMARFALAYQNPKIVGLPEEITLEYFMQNGLKSGFMFALYNYAVTGHTFQQSDYGKYIRPLNQYQVEIMNSALEKLSK